MSSNLLQQFLSQECTPYVRRLLEEALENASPPTRRLEFNRFELTIQHEDGEILVEDVLDETESGVQRVPLADFAASLEKCCAK